MRAEECIGDHNAWQWLRDLLLTLQRDGMSSDESDVEDNQIVYRVTVMPWRRRDVANCMELIDSQRMNSDAGFSQRGSKPGKRVRGVRNPESKRKHLNGLPRQLYDDNWWEANHRRLGVEVSEEPFEWKMILTR